MKRKAPVAVCSYERYKVLTRLELGLLSILVVCLGVKSGYGPWLLLRRHKRHGRLIHSGRRALFLGSRLLLLLLRGWCRKRQAERRLPVGGHLGEGARVGAVEGGAS